MDATTRTISRGEQMSDLIDKQKAIDAVAFGITYAKAFDKETGEVKVKELFAEGNYELKKAIDRIKELPSVDAVEVVLCKDCIWRLGTDCTRFAEVRVSPEDYCSRGEAKTKRSRNEKEQS